jgi:hypothetical protein
VPCYERLLQDLGRYNAAWYEELHVSDLATWLSNWEGKKLLDIHLEALAERKVATNLWELARAAKIARAAYIALPGRTARSIASDPHFQLLLDLTVIEREEYRAQRLEARQRLLKTLRALLPDRYNNNGGAP